MGQNGGKRPGAGRPKGSLNADNIRKQAIRKRILSAFEENLAAIVGAQVQNAIGLNHFFLRDEKTKQFVRVTDPEMIQTALNAGDEGSYYWVHTKDPSTQAFTALADRAIDKPSEHVELTGADGSPLVVQWLSKPGPDV